MVVAAASKEPEGLQDAAIAEQAETPEAELPAEEPAKSEPEPVAEQTDPAEEAEAQPAPAAAPPVVVAVVPKETPEPAPVAAPVEEAEAEPVVVAQAPAEQPKEEAPQEAPAEAVETAPPPPPPRDIRQVQIQVWISETSEQGLRDLGTNLQYKRVVNTVMPDGTVRQVEQDGSVQQINTNVFNPLNRTFGVTLPAPDPTFFATMRPDQNNGPANGIQTQSGAGLVASVIRSDYGTLDAVFRGIEQKSDVDLISKPEILVLDNGLAEIHAGGEVPYQDIIYSDKGVGQLRITFQKIGVDLKIQPLILPDNSIQLHIQELGVSDVVRYDNIRGIDLPVFAKRSQTGMVIVPNGQTLVIGGLSSRVVRKSERRVPIIGSLPLIGIPFRGRHSEAANSHLLIFVSPTVVDLREPTGSAVKALNFWKARRWKNADRIARELEVMQYEP